MKTRYIEYYEVVDPLTGDISYYYMPVDAEAKNKRSMDWLSLRIWKYDTRYKEFIIAHNKRDNPVDISKREFLQIQIKAKPVPYDEVYLMKQKREGK